MRMVTDYMKKMWTRCLNWSLIYAGPPLRMRTMYKYAIIFTCIVSLVIIKKESILRASGELTQGQAPQTLLNLSQQGLPSSEDMGELTQGQAPQTLLNLSQQGLPSEEPSEEDMDAVRHFQQWLTGNRSQKSFFRRTISNSGGHQHILILAACRTGSSFVGEFFNQHGDNMFYLYEPLWHVWDTLKSIERAIGVTVTTSQEAVALIQNDVLRGLFLCDFAPLEKFMWRWPEDHMLSALFRRESSVVLCTKPVCTPVDRDVWHQCKTQSCGPLDLTLATRSCHTKEHRAIKVVRVDRLDRLRPLVEDPRLDMRVIHLVRDPRAKLASRMVAFASDYQYQKWQEWARHGQVPPEDDEDVRWLRSECERDRTSAMVGLSQPRWLRRRYMLLRYEDVARYPVRKAEEMYRFAGIPFSAQAREWIGRNTQAAKTEAAGDTFSTERNSSEQADQWRLSLPYELAQVVQRLCGPTMELFGYSFVDDEKTLVNRSVSLLDPSYLM